MMWRTHDGERVFTECEWEMFATGLDMLRSFVESDIGTDSICFESGIPVFDTLTPEQKLALLADVSLALRDVAVPAPPLTAANEGAVAAVFDTFYDMLCSQLDAAKDGLKATSIRRLILTAIGDDSDREEKLPSPRRKKRET